MLDGGRLVKLLLHGARAYNCCSPVMVVASWPPLAACGACVPLVIVIQSSHMFPLEYCQVFCSTLILSSSRSNGSGSARVGTCGCMRVYDECGIWCFVFLCVSVCVCECCLSYRASVACLVWKCKRTFNRCQSKDLHRPWVMKPTTSNMQQYWAITQPF